MKVSEQAIKLAMVSHGHWSLLPTWPGFDQAAQFYGLGHLCPNRGSRQPHTRRVASYVPGQPTEKRKIALISAKSSSGVKSRIVPASIRRGPESLEEQQTVATHDSGQHGDQADEQQDSVQPLDAPEGCFRLQLGLP